MSSEKGASSWLSVLPIEEHGFALHKEAFYDALCLCYGWSPVGLPFICVCGSGFTVDHVGSHNDFTVSVLCHDVAIEPALQKMIGKSLQYVTANVEDEAHVDYSAQGFRGGRYQRGFFDVREISPIASSYAITLLLLLCHSGIGSTGTMGAGAPSQNCLRKLQSNYVIT